jgi:putative transposase
VIRKVLDSISGWLALFLAGASSVVKSRTALQLENLALRHQITVLQRSAKKRPRLQRADRLLWVWMSRVWEDWRSSLVIVKPETVVAWHRNAFRLFWTWKIRRGKTGRPTVPREVRDLISRENPGWGAPRIHGELLKLGINIGETSVSEYLIRNRKPPSQSWRTFLENHLTSFVSVDFFTVPTIGFRSSTSSSCLRTSVGASFTSPSRHIRLQGGLHSSSGKLFRGTARHVICCATGIASSGITSLSR